ncbi:MAG: hypothetical protein C0429_16915 [Sphingopyxis sp.]|jgi:hypothetical protein|nr:hypothetical protein [Sphingopyxis sp.]
MKLHYPLFASLLALSACASPPPAPPPAPVAKPAPVVTPAPAPQRPKGSWLDWPLEAGDWVYRRDERGSLGLFGPTGQNATVTLRCDTTRRRLYLARAGAGAAARMTVRTSSSLKELTASPTGATPPYLAVEILPTDPILDAMAFSRGRIALEVEGQQPIAIPSWTEITRIVEDCRA